MLGRDDFISGKRFKDIECKSLGGWARLQSLSVSEYIEFENLQSNYRDDTSQTELVGLFLTFCLVDEDNNRILTSSDIPAVLETVAPAELMDIFNAAQELNGLSDTEEDQEKK